MKVRVKICGITRRCDAEAAIALGADAIGFILAKSPRRISLSDIPLISQGLPNHVLRVGVFVNPTLEEVETAAELLSGIQLHGEESPELVRQIKERHPNHYLIKALQPSALARCREFQCDAVLVDPPRHRRGNLPVAVVAGVSVDKPLFVAGGINLENIGGLLENLNPYGVDLSSGVESSPGIKDPKKMKQFFQALKEHS